MSGAADRLGRTLRVISGELPDHTKEALAKQLGEVGKAARMLKASLLCQIDGIGRYDHGAYQGRRKSFFAAVDEVREILSDTAPAEGLLAELEP